MIPWQRSALILLVALAAGACSHFRARPAVAPAPATPEDRLHAAMAALDSGQYAAATKDLLALSQEYPGQAAGRAALLGAAAAELDPRNPDRQLDQGASLLVQYLSGAPANDWTEPVAASFYLLAQEAGASAERVEAAQADAARAREQARAGLPRLPGASLTARLQDVQHDRDRLAARVRELETTTATLSKQLADSVQELSRIRRTLRP
ncbi:MAG TPA: hypothetical protein VF832_12710 [Longimicrobiales bacterium]